MGGIEQHKVKALRTGKYGILGCFKRNLEKGKRKD
jgi:hypothetical protein